MKKITKILTTTCALLVIMGMSIMLTACFGGGGQTKDYIKIYGIGGNRAPVGTELEVDTDSNFTNYTDYCKYEFIENNCGATMSSKSFSGSTHRYVKATRAGTCVVKKSYNDGYRKLESNLLTLEFYYDKFINTVDDLQLLNNSTDAYVLKNDLDLKGIKWEPITNFSGTLFGDGHKISNMNVNFANQQFMGLFAELKGTIENLSIEKATVTSNGNANYAGIVAGKMEGGALIDVKVGGTVNTRYYDYVGGLCGSIAKGTEVSNCVNNATIYGQNKVGGLFGYASTAYAYKKNRINNVINNGDVTAQNGESIGGVIGFLASEDNGSDYALANFTNNGTINGTSKVGGVIGSLEYGTYNFTQFKNQGEVKGKTAGNYVGGLIGHVNDSNTGSNIAASSNQADISGGNYVGGIIGYGAQVDIVMMDDDNANANIISGLTYVGGVAGRARFIENAVNKGDIKATGTMTIDSKNYTIVGGIAGYCNGLTNCVNYSDITITKNGLAVGGLVGYLESRSLNDSNTLFNNENKGTITSPFDDVGGIAGYVKNYNTSYDYKMVLNTNHGAITGRSYVGGIFGYMYNSHANLSQLTNNAEIKGDMTNGEGIGGLIGGTNYYYNKAIVLSVSENYGDVTGTTYVGGWVGYGPDIEIDTGDYANTNTITGKDYVGGIAGFGGHIKNAVNNGDIVASNGTYVGGIAGSCFSINYCVNNKDITVTSNGKYVGGIVGYLSISANSSSNENYGIVTGINYVGGIAGCASTGKSSSTYQITFNENKAAVNGTTCVGGIIGGTENCSGWMQITNCTNDALITSSTSATSVGGIVGYASAATIKTDANIMDTNTTYQTTNKLGN